MSLLEKAKASKIHKHDGKIDREKVEVAVAFMKDEVSLGQIAEAMGTRGKQSVQARLSLWCREAYRIGLITETK